MNLLDNIRKINTQVEEYEPFDVNQEWNTFQKKANIPTIQEPSKKNFRIIRFYPLFKAAALVIGVLGIYLLARPSQSMELHTSVAESVTLNMIDGSVIYLDSFSEITYPKKLKNLSERKLNLKGSAKFDVAHNPDLPFIVECGDILVKALGTVFSIKQIDGIIEIVEIKGKIEVKDKINSSSPIILNAGDKIIYKNGAFQLKITPLAPVPAAETLPTDLLDDEEVISNTPEPPVKLEKGINSYLVRDVMKELTRRFPGKIKVARKIRNDKKRTLKLDLNGQKDYLLQVIGKDSRYHIKPGKCADCFEIELKKGDKK